MTESKSSPPLGRRSALLIIDIQNDFFPRGTMEIEGASRIIPIINTLRKHNKWELIVLVGDSHPQNHISFLSTHINRSNVTIGSTITTPSGHQQVIVPAHCVQGSLGAQFHSILDRSPSDLIIQKGTHPEYDNYSAFFDAYQSQRTALLHALQHANVTDVYITGLGKDVANTAVDAAQAGFNAYIISDAVVDISPAHERTSTARLEKALVIIEHSRMLLEKREDRRQEAAAYLEQHQLAPLFERLCSALVYEKPTDPRAFLIKELQSIQQGQQKGSDAKLATSTIFNESDFETMFKMMDPLSQGTLTSKQVTRALSDLGFQHASSSVVEDVKYNVEQFKQLCVKSATAARTV